MKNKLRVLIADDSFVVRERLVSILSSINEVEVIGQATDAVEATAAIRELKPDVAILDIHMPNTNGNNGDKELSGIDVLPAIKEEPNPPYVVMLSNYYYAQYKKRCLELGADVFLHKSKEFEKIGEVLLKFIQRRNAASGTPAMLAETEQEAPAVRDEAETARPLPDEVKSYVRVSYALRRVPLEDFATLLPCPKSVKTGDIVLTRLEKIGRNTRLELTTGRNSNLHEGDLLALVFGNRYATEQFEGYADIDGHFCDLLSMGGLCGLVKSKHASVPDASRLRVLGMLGDAEGRPLSLHDYALPPVSAPTRPRVIVVCGTSMDSGKTYTAFSIIFGLHSHGYRVGAFKLTGTAAGRDTWSMLDAGANPTLDFIDGGWPSTYLCSVEGLIELHALLCGHVADQGADWVVIEVADGLLQAETAALLQDPRFTDTVDVWVFAAGDPLAATGGVSVLRSWGIEPIALSGRFTMSPLSMREAAAATGLPCFTARKLQYGDLNERLVEVVGSPDIAGVPALRELSDSREAL